MPEPAVFSEMAFKKSSHFRISTSQVATKAYGLMAFGPVVEDGYSLCYNPRDNDILFAIGAFNSNKETNAEKFGEMLCKTLRDVQDLLNRNQKNKCLK